MKGTIARKLFMKHPELKEQLWGGRGRPPRDLEKLQKYHKAILDQKKD